MQASLWLLMGGDGGSAGSTSGPPQNVSSYLYEGTKVGVQWTAGDADARTQIAESATCGGAKTILATVSSGVTNWETGQEQADVDVLWVRHVTGSGKLADFSAWVQVVDGEITFLECP